MSTIHLEANPAFGRVDGYSHLYLVYRDNNGDEFVIRGGWAYD